MLNVIILAAGQGTRMHSQVPKVLHTLGGRSMLGHVLATAQELDPLSICIVAHPKLPLMNDCRWVVQEQPLGTGDAVRLALDAIPLEGHGVVLYGDAPLVQASTLKKLYAYYKALPTPALMVVAMETPHENRYGRLVMDDQHQVKRIVEYNEASEAERALPHCNSGVLFGPLAVLKELTQRLEPTNQAKEYYLTDCVALARTQEIPVFACAAPHEEFCGINTRVELAAAEAMFQARWRSHWLNAGVTLVDASSVHFSFDSHLDADVTVYPFVTFGLGVRVASHSTILSFCHIEHSDIGEGAVIGPFAHLRGGNTIGSHTAIGNFVEVKKAVLGSEVKAKHLSYLGDVTIGAKTNVGAGMICVNYDGFHKHQTTIGEGVALGANTALIAPVTVGDGAVIAAGSVITKDVPDQALAMARNGQTNKLNGAISYRQRKSRS